MTNLSNNSEDELERLRMENELKKAKLMLEHGASFSDTSGKSPVHPLIENEFLNSIQAFEENYREAKPILLYDFIKRPEFSAVGSIPDSQINEELDKLIHILNENGIQIDTICDVEEREIYRFITEELFSHEIDNMRIPEMMTCFIYEDFHPNHEYDIRNLCNDGIKSFLNKENDYYTNHFTEEAKGSTWYTDYRDAFGSFTLAHFEIIQLNFDKEKAYVRFNIDFTGTVEGGDDTQHFSGEGTLELLNQYGYWYIQKITFPTPAKCL
jgi:hypothetical protein